MRIEEKEELSSVCINVVSNKGGGKMRRALSVFAILFLMLLAAQTAEAGQSENVTITVTVVPDLSVRLSGSNLAFGSVTAGSTTVSSAGITVENNGSGVEERFSLSHSTSGGLTSGTAPGADTFVLNAAFADTAAGAVWAHVDSVVSDAAAYNETKKLWFQFKAPTSTASAAEQAITVTVTAQLP